MNEQEQQTVDAYTRTQAPVCIGRFQVAMPQQLTLGYSTLTVNDARISAKFTSRQMFQRFIRERREELANTETYHQRDQPYLKNVYDIDSGTVVFDRNEDDFTPDSSRILEGYRLVNTTMFKVTLGATDVDANRYQDQHKYRKTNKPKRLKQVEYLLQNLHPRKAHDIPDTPGLCFDGGFLAGGAEEPIPGAALPFREELIGMTFVDRQRRDVNFIFHIDNTIVEKDTLLDRTGNAESVLGQDDHFSVLRKGTVKLEGVGQAQEWLITQTTDQGIRGHYFNLEANSTLKASEFPYLDISFRNGDFPPREPHKELSQASLTDAEAAGLWDAITRSFRARANAF
ncbi:MAG: T6SS immunity protein Tli4 family protein [Pseudomonadota bacterium]